MVLAKQPFENFADDDAKRLLMEIDRRVNSFIRTGKCRRGFGGTSLALARVRHHRMPLAQVVAVKRIRLGCEVKQEICSYYGRAESIHRIELNLSLSADFFAALWCNAEVSPLDPSDK